MRPIDADKLTEDIDQLREGFRKKGSIMNAVLAVLICIIIQIVKRQPVIEAEPVKHAKWEISFDGYCPYCTNCRYEPPREAGMTEYCPKCGAKMDEKKK